MFPVPAGREEQLGSHSTLSWEGWERAAVSKTKRYNPLVGMPTLPVGAGGGGDRLGGQSVAACPRGKADSSLLPQEELSRAEQDALGGSGSGYPTPLPKPGWISDRGLRCWGTLCVP